MGKKKSGLAFGTHVNAAGDVAKNKGKQNQVPQGFGSFSFGAPPVRSGTAVAPGPPPVKDSGSYTRIGAGFGDLGSGAPAQADAIGSGGGGGEGSQVLSPTGDIAYAIGSVAGKDVADVIAQGARRTRKTRRPGSI
jgi:hypothetical protein